MERGGGGGGGGALTHNQTLFVEKMLWRGCKPKTDARIHAQSMQTHAYVVRREGERERERERERETYIQTDRRIEIGKRGVRGGG